MIIHELIHFEPGNVSCFFKNRNSETDPAKLAEICIRNPGDDWMTIEQCVKKDNITELMANRTEKANKYLENGLAIFINDVHNQEARKDLIKQICSLLPVSIFKFIELFETKNLFFSFSMTHRK